MARKAAEKLTKTELNKLKKMLETQRALILNSDRVRTDDLRISQDDLMDEADLASSDVELSMQARFKNKNNMFLRKIDEALNRMDDGNYGCCDSCGANIGFKRLECRPVTDMCIDCKEEQEKSENGSVHGRQSKSLGRAFVTTKGGIG